MCFDICIINIRVSIRVRGLHLVFFIFLSNPIFSVLPVSSTPSRARCQRLAGPRPLPETKESCTTTSKDVRLNWRHASWTVCKTSSAFVIFALRCSRDVDSRAWAEERVMHGMKSIPHPLKRLANVIWELVQYANNLGEYP